MSNEGLIGVELVFSSETSMQLTVALLYYELIIVAWDDVTTL